MAYRGWTISATPSGFLASHDVNEGGQWEIWVKNQLAAILYIDDMEGE